MLTVSAALGINIFDKAILGLNEGIEITTKKSYTITQDVKFEEIKALRIKVSQTSWEAFLQVCQRLYMHFGNPHAYLDLEAQVMFVYDYATDTPEVHYFQFK